MNQVSTSPTRPQTAIRFGRIAVCALLVAVSAACDKDSSNPLGPGTGDLTSVEATQMFSALVAAYGLVPTPTVPSGGGGSAASVPMVTISVDTTQFTNQCTAGGTATVLSHDSLRIVDDTRTNPSPDTTYATTIDFSGRFDITTSFQGCGSTDSSGNTWTFDASPGMNLVFDFTGSTDIAQLTSGVSIMNWMWNWDGTWTGNLSWSSNGKSGQCPVSVLWTASSVLNASGTTTTATNQSGTVCGVNVNLTS